MSVISTRCKEVFFRKHLRDHFQCSRNAVEDGYCKQHHPESRKALFIKNEARYNADRLKRASTTDVRLAELEKEIAALHERLEDNRAYDVDGKRIEVKPGSIPDGIYCRDETIKLQDEYIKELESKLKE